MTDQLNKISAEMAMHFVHRYGWTIAKAAAYVRHRMAEAHREYQALGAPYGDDDRGFYLWLTRRPTTPAALREGTN